MKSIEDVILAGDRRGIARVRPYLPAAFCGEAARALRERCARVLIATGFVVGGRGETDGPPGALALARAIQACGGNATLVSDGHAAWALMRMAEADVVAFPLLDAEGSRREAEALLSRLLPTAVIAVERCGRTADGTYHNMRGVDISAATAILDDLFKKWGQSPTPRAAGTESPEVGQSTPEKWGQPPTPPPAGSEQRGAAATFLTIGVGDGGNEIGMGSLAEALVKEGVTDLPCVTRVDHPIIAAVSNWGAWGLVAALSLETGRNLLPGEEECGRDLENLVRLGCVDGITGRSEATVDGWSLAENLEVASRLHDQVQRSLAGEGA